ncbi:uncharacterized protein EV422DRAFT_523145 [Fimicolochytrium jonesii]|uniref:uncharacterized protein n=1 Tax=Fimicolochytrium jonesii TaxID=1396493 RepID=UPI0022FE0E8C|nr:uncharacterized protein EV422DRAFT_523145 [Fimicolochytrium jonesii]KAI8823041.1 hypothetical protein EV422DRAFT_523145 [Fimicolochytrium jonesii]
MDVDGPHLLELLLSNYLLLDNPTHAPHRGLSHVLQTVTSRHLLHQLYLLVQEEDLKTGAGAIPQGKTSLTARAAAALHKWGLRITSLLASKQPAAKWTAACMALVSADQAYGAFQKDIRGWCNGLLVAVKDAPGGSSVASGFVGDYVGAFSLLLVKSKAFPALQRDLNQLYLAKTVGVVCEKLAGSNTDGRASAETKLRLFIELTTLLVNFPNALKASFERIELACVSTLVNMDEPKEVVEAATGCLLTIAKVGKEKGSASVSEAVPVNKIIASIHEVLDLIFSCMPEADRTEADIPGFVVPALQGEYGAIVPALLSRYDTFATALFTVLTRTSTAFAATTITALVRRIYAVASRLNLLDSTSLTTNPNVSLLQLSIPSICIKANDFMYAAIIRNACADYKLAWTICSKAIDLSHRHTALRLSAYALVRKCVDVYSSDFVRVGGAVLAKTVANDMKLVSAVTRPGETQQQQQQQQQSGQGSKKRKLHVTSDTPTRDDSHAVWEIKLAALSTLETLITSSHTEHTELDLTPLLHAALQSLLLSSSTPPIAATAIQPHKFNHFDSPVHAYQHALLTVLIAAVECRTGKSGDVLPIAARVFAALLWHPDMRVRETCKTGLRRVDVVVHPRLPRFEYARKEEIVEVEVSAMDALVGNGNVNGSHKRDARPVEDGELHGSKKRRIAEEEVIVVREALPQIATSKPDLEVKTAAASPAITFPGPKATAPEVSATATPSNHTTSSTIPPISRTFQQQQQQHQSQDADDEMQIDLPIPTTASHIATHVDADGGDDDDEDIELPEIVVDSTDEDDDDEDGDE